MKVIFFVCLFLFNSYKKICLFDSSFLSWNVMLKMKEYTVEPLYNEVLGTMKITLLYQVFRYIRVKKQRNIKSWDQQNDLVIRGFCYIRPLYNEVPLYYTVTASMIPFVWTDIQ